MVSDSRDSERLRAKTAHATRWSAMAEVCAKLFTPIVSMVLARLLTPEAFGVVATVNIVISFADMLSDAGFQKYLVQHDFHDKESLDKTSTVAFWTNLGISCLIWGVFSVFSDFFAGLVGSPGYGTAIIAAGSSLPLTAFSSIQMARFKRAFDFKTLFSARLISVFTPILVTVPLAFILHNYWALIIGTIAVNLCNAIFLIIKSSWKPSFYYSVRIFREMFAYSWWILMESFANWAANYLDVLFVGRALNSYYLGLYKTSTTTEMCIRDRAKGVQKEYGPQGAGAAAKARRLAWLRGVAKRNPGACIVAFEYFVNMQTIIACAGLGNRLVVSERNDPARVGGGRGNDWLRERLYRRAAMLVCQTDDAAAHFSAKVAKTVILNPVKEGLPEPFGGERRHTVVSFCRLEKQKNLSMLLRAFSKFHREHSGWTLEVYGDGSERESLDALASELGLIGKVSLNRGRSDVHEAAVSYTHLDLNKALSSSNAYVINDYGVVEIGSVESSKLAAVNLILKEKRVDPSHVYVVGDDGNDIGLLRSYPNSFAVANSRSEVMEAASYVVSSNNDCGVAEVVERIEADRKSEKAWS